MINDVIIPIIFGSVQGLTEFLPISSSGHLVILHNYLDFSFSNDIAFDVFLHLATLMAAILYFWKDILEIAKAVLLNKKGADNNRRIGWFIALATIPAALSGYLWDDKIEYYLRDISVVVTMLVLIGLLFLLVEKKSRQKIDNYKNLKWGQSLKIGMAQALALIPGTSRSGITMISGMWLGLKREEAIKFSFILSIPIIAGANLVKLPTLLDFGVSNEISFLPLILAFLSSFLVGFLSIKYLLKFAKQNKLNVFAYYRIALALLLVLDVFFF